MNPSQSLLTEASPPTVDLQKNPKPHSSSQPSNHFHFSIFPRLVIMDCFLGFSLSSRAGLRPFCSLISLPVPETS